MELREFYLLDLKPLNKNIIYHCDGQKLIQLSIYVFWKSLGIFSIRVLSSILFLFLYKHA